MGTVFKKQTTRPLPPGAEVTARGGERVARWRVRGKWRTAPLTTGQDGTDRIVTESGTYFAKFRDANGNQIVKPTGCRDKQAAEQLLKKWEREVEQIKSGTLDRKALDVARQATAPLEDHLAAYERSLRAAEVTNGHLKNVLRAVRKVSADCGFLTPASFNRQAVEDWLAARVAEGMSARSRNYYRVSLVAFANWCEETGRVTGHDLRKVPKANEKADPRRPRRALTIEELVRLLDVAVTRPLVEARTVRRGKQKGQQTADVRSEIVAHLRRMGRERALIYKTLVLTGLRKNELATLTVGQLHFTEAGAFLQLDAADEKNREGNALPLRDDLADDLRRWLGEQLARLQEQATKDGEPIPLRMPAAGRVFDVPAGLLRILDRDLMAAGIPKRDDRGRTVDVHAIRTTFGTLLSTTGTAPRTAQLAMRHSDIDLTMKTYTDERHLDVRGAVNRLPDLPLPKGGEEPEAGVLRKTGTDDRPGGGTGSVAPAVAPTRCNGGQSGSVAGTEGRPSGLPA